MLVGMLGPRHRDRALRPTVRERSRDHRTRRSAFDHDPRPRSRSRRVKNAIATVCHRRSRSWSRWSRSCSSSCTWSSAAPSILDWDFLTDPIPFSDRLPGPGMGPAVAGTLLITGAAALMAIPLGILGGIYLNEYGGKKRAGAAHPLPLRGDDRRAVDRDGAVHLHVRRAAAPRSRTGSPARWRWRA